MVRTSTMPTMPVVISQKPALASRKLAGVERVTRGHTYTAPPTAHITNVPKTVMCECPTTKSVKCVGCWSERSASTEPWKQPMR